MKINKQQIKNYLKPRLIDFGKFIIEIFILIGAIITFIPLSIIGFIYTSIKHLFFKFDYSISKQFGPVIRALTLSLDGLANSWVGEMFNDVFKPIIKYGNWNRTISQNTGINKLLDKDKTLNNKFYIFYSILNKILGNKHCENSITKEQNKYYL